MDESTSLADFAIARFDEAWMKSALVEGRISPNDARGIGALLSEVEKLRKVRDAAAGSGSIWIEPS